MILLAPTKTLLKGQFFSWYKKFLASGNYRQGRNQTGGGYDHLTSICLGAMLAWTPSLVLMAWLLHDAPLDELDRDPS
jgi:hypothetical protein